MRRRSAPALVFAAVLGALVAVGPVPAAAQQDFPVTPDPAACQVEPRAADDLLALWYGPAGSPVAALPNGEAATEVVISLGPPADAATVAAIEATVVEVFACFAAGDFPRATALFTDELVARFGPEPGTPEEEARAFVEATPEPEGEPTLILAITDVMDLGGGRVGAFVVERSGGDPPLTSYAVFVESDGRWLVDDVVEFSTPAFEEGEGTPAP